MNLCCPYCKDTISAVLEYTSSGWSEHRDLTGYECDKWECGAEWNARCEVVTEGKNN